ncbi:hypothetical protein MRB53_021701 [Persea americana]|uniref:Uncharacterized protein n=1 Tax=Persea americana TaxID=3435 RepID=A0ACC2L5R6_PERAE|nr:hypothetical protein MRB53_021701 [Persea americana]
MGQIPLLLFGRALITQLIHYFPKHGLGGRNKVTGETQRLITWKNHDDPMPGMFSFGFDPNGTNRFSCTAYAYYNGCSLWNSDLINLQQLSSGEGQDLYLRLAATELRDLGRKKEGMTGAPIGRRNSEKLEDGESAFFPCWTVGKIAKVEVLALLDYRLDGNANMEELTGNANMEELTRASRVAYWCIRDDENDRPAIGNVVQILKGLIDINMPPIPRSIRILIDNSS